MKVKTIKRIKIENLPEIYIKPLSSPLLMEYRRLIDLDLETIREDDLDKLSENSNVKEIKRFKARDGRTAAHIKLSSDFIIMVYYESSN
jgi:hypothetical protein